MAKKNLNPVIANLVRRYKKELEKNKINVQKMFVFGSHTKDNAKPYSDIDVAIITNDLSQDDIANYVTLRKFVKKLDWRIEPHSFTLQQFNDYWNPLAAEIKKYGIPI